MPLASANGNEPKEPEIRELILEIDAKKVGWRTQYFATLSEAGLHVTHARMKLPDSFLDSLKRIEAIEHAATSETFKQVGKAWFDCVFPIDGATELPVEQTLPQQAGNSLRSAFFNICQQIVHQGQVLRLCIVIGDTLAKWPEYQFYGFRPDGLGFSGVSWESFWIEEWQDESQRPAGVESPFLALNSWVTIVRRPQNVAPQPHMTSIGRIDVLVILSNPHEGDDLEMRHLPEANKLADLVQGISKHETVGWVAPLVNPTKHDVAQTIKRHQPRIIVYVGHGYFNGKGCGLALAPKEAGGKIDYVSGLRQGSSGESELEQMLAGKTEPTDQGLDLDDRPRLCILIACQASLAAPALLQSGIPAVLAMRKIIPAGGPTASMLRYLFDALVTSNEPLEVLMSHLRAFLSSEDAKWTQGDAIHFTTPVLHLAAGDGRVFGTRSQYARGRFIDWMRAKCLEFDRVFVKSMSTIDDGTYIKIKEELKETTLEPQQPRSSFDSDAETGRGPRWTGTPFPFGGDADREHAIPKETSHEFAGALRDEHYRKLVIIGAAGRGKSSLLKHTVLKELDELAGNEWARVPIFVPLKELADGATLQDWFTRQVQAGWLDATTLSWLNDRIVKGKILLLLDALDELPKSGRDVMLGGTLKTLVSQLDRPATSIVVTCRDLVYHEVANTLEALHGPKESRGFVKMELKPFNSENIEAYANRYFGTEADEFLESIKDGIDSRQPYTHLATEPLYLSMLCFIYASTASVSDADATGV